MICKSLGDYSFFILITLDFIKPYGNISMQVYASFFFIFIESLFYWTIFSSYHEWFAILWLPRVDYYLWIALI